MTEVQTITKQLATYEAKVNATEYQQQRAVQEIDHCRKEQARLGVLLELGEVDRTEIEALAERERQALQVRDEASTQLELSNRAKAELRTRLASAMDTEHAAARREALLGYRDTAEDLLGLLEQVGERYARLSSLSRKVGDARLEGVSRAGSLATERWPEYLRHDLSKIEAKLAAEVGA